MRRRDGSTRKIFAFRALICLVLLILAVPGITAAQLVTAALRGAVTDPQGAAVPDAEVTITDTATTFTRTVTASSDGVYNFPDLPLGSYRLRVSHPGFKAAEWTGIVLHVADSVVINVKLEVGPVSEQVTVEASAIQVETASGDLTALIQGNQVQQLPLNGRNFMELVTLIPGVAPGEAFSAQAKGVKGGADLSISGGAVDANLWLVDGAHNTQ